PQVVMLPEGFAHTVDSVKIGWSFANDPHSGIVSYEYGIGTSLTNTDVISWKSLPQFNRAYIIGQGPEEFPGESTESGNEKSKGKNGTIIEGFNSGLSPKETHTLQADFIAEEEGFAVTHNQHYYGLVRVTNGMNLQSIGASQALTIDATGPDSVTITSPEQSTDTTKIPLHITATDSQSGIAAYRYAVWKYTTTSRIPEKDDFIHEAGFVSQGMITGTFQSQGNLYNSPAEQALGNEQFYENLDPSMLESVIGPPWFERGWHTISNGINPAGINMNLDLTGFPGNGLQPGTMYKIKVWVKNGAGIEKVSNTATVTIKELPKKETIKIKPKTFK
ncbi:MAG: hypothetical protein JXJ04_09230, partial [Spirochaetales bacterium]|nr:hypothetical protein [Spirochaetales bacterium]